MYNKTGVLVTISIEPSILLMSKLLEFSLEMKAAARMKFIPEGRYMKEDERNSVSLPERKC